MIFLHNFTVWLSGLSNASALANWSGGWKCHWNWFATRKESVSTRLRFQGQLAVVWMLVLMLMLLASVFASLMTLH